MSVLDRLMAVVAPHDCLGCGAEGRLLCAACLRQLKPSLPTCYRCRLPSPGSLTCADCRLVSGLDQARAAVVYEKLAKDLIWKLKSSHAQSAAREIAVLMAALPGRWPRGDWLIVPVPTATSRVRQRGYDQARLLARELARESRQPWADGLIRQSQADQVGASRQQRRGQLAGAFRVAKPRLVGGRDILLVDDVVTTGATLEAAAAVLRAAGAGRITALVFAQPELGRHVI